MATLIDLTGQRFGRLTVQGLAGKGNGSKPLWRCVCDCGNHTVVYAGNLRSGSTVSCGCYRKDNAKIMRTTHGGKKTRLYNIWRGVKSRCTNQKNRRYGDYGGRGITVCNEWANRFEAFRDWALANGYRDDLTIERQDNDGPYSPDNCRWATMAEQNCNRRFNHTLTHNGETHTLAEWARATGIKESTLWRRLKTYGWSVERTLTTKTRR